MSWVCPTISLAHLPIRTPHISTAGRLVIKVQHLSHVIRWWNENVSDIFISTQECCLDVVWDQTKLVRGHPLHGQSFWHSRQRVTVTWHLYQIWILKAQHAQTCFCLSSRRPCQDPSRTQDSLLTSYWPNQTLGDQAMIEAPTPLPFWEASDLSIFSHWFRHVFVSQSSQQIHLSLNCHQAAPQRLSSPQLLLHSDHHLLEQEATQILALDQSPSFADLFPQHEVAFPVHHQLLVNPLELEFVVSVVVVVVVLDLVSTPGAHVLVVVLVHLVSPVVLVLDEIAVVFDPCVIAVSMVATRTVVAHVVFAAETLSVAAVVSGPAFWVHHVWSAHRDRLVLQVMPFAAVPLHPSAHQTFSEIP